MFEEEKESHCGWNITTVNLPDILVQWAQCMLNKKITEMKTLSK